MTPAEIQQQFFAGTSFLIRGKAYPSPLPNDLEPWYCYTSDGGHSLLALLDGLIEPDEPNQLWQQLCPVPVMTVLRGYHLHEGFIVAEQGFRYDSQLGLQTDPNDDEF